MRFLFFLLWLCFVEDVVRLDNVTKNIFYLLRIHISFNARLYLLFRFKVPLFHKDILLFDLKFPLFFIDWLFISIYQKFFLRNDWLRLISCLKLSVVCLIQSWQYSWMALRSSRHSFADCDIFRMVWKNSMRGSHTILRLPLSLVLWLVLLWVVGNIFRIKIL